MSFSSRVAFLFSFLLFGLPEAYADDVSEGRNLFITRCLGCHAFACNKQGPRLAGLFGRKVGSVEDYGSYSQGLKDANFVWTGKSLDAFFTDPAQIFPKSVMALNGKNEDSAQRRKIIAFLKTEDPTVNLCPQK
jgi:cytochrome c